MIQPRLFLCSGVKVAQNDPLRQERRVIDLTTQGRKANVNVRLEDVAKVLAKDLSPRLLDLLELAAFAYTADCGTSRGEEWADEDTKEAWDRDFQFVIPVRDLAFWNQQETGELLVEILESLSDDKYTFHFRQFAKEPGKQGYLEFAEGDDWPFQGVDRVLMFSGGLDSLAGAVETAAKSGNLVLVSHRPVATQSKRQIQLFEALKESLRKTPSVQMIHVPVWINKEKALGREHTQRTRSFLYSTLGTIVAESVKAGGVRFFENGVVSLNLPLADEALRARASRTTHPLVLDLFTKFLASSSAETSRWTTPFCSRPRPML